MALRTGTRLGPYEIIEPIGAGGMGEVYRATDTKLVREVAIKVLPEAVAQDRERLARFEREARLLASLNHPNIATIHGLEELDAVRYLVMELVEGETLAERIAKGAIPIEETLPIFQQIAEGLEAAHEKGIIHRDFKPANIKITPEGKVKILDFGLAKAFSDEAPAADLSQAPTLTREGTRAGVIMGTPAYMSPEQARGKALDKRTDIWAFGCCLYEALTGKTAFLGETVSDTIAAVLRREPDWEHLQPTTPASIQRLLRRCLQKDQNRRMRDAWDARIEIGEVLQQPEAEISTGEISKPKRRLLRVGGLLAAAVLGSLLTWWFGTWRGSAPSMVALTPAMRSVIDLPPEAPLALGGLVPQIGFESPVIAISPDGSQLVYVGESDEGKKLYLRSMASYEVTPIPGTEDAVYAFFSPDGRWVGFLTTDKVKKASLQGGAPMTLCDVRGPVRASWISDDTIYFVGKEGSVLNRVPAGGGEPSIVYQSNAKLMFSQVLPDGKSALVTDYMPRSISMDYADILLLSLETHETKRLIESGYDARYVPSGHLIFARSGSLLAVSFDIERLEVSGEPFPVVSDVSMESFFMQVQVAFSDNGQLVYVPGGDIARGKLAWVDRQGNTAFLAVPEMLYGVFDISPDGRRLAVHVADVNDYIWIYDVRREAGRRLAAEESSGWPVWTPRGDSIAYTSWRPGEVRRLLRRTVDGSGVPEELYAGVQRVRASSWSPGGRVLAFTSNDGFGGIGLLTIGGPRDPEWVQTEGTSLWCADFSPDDRWIAYNSNETGRYEIWVRSLTDREIVHQISVGGGMEPVWCRECGELFYRQGNRWMSSTIKLEPELAWETPRLVFETDFIDTFGRSYDISPDGQRLLVVKRTEEPTRTKLHVVHNWFEELKRLVPTDN